MKVTIKKVKEEDKIFLSMQFPDDSGCNALMTLAELNKLQIDIDNFISNYNPECQAFDSTFDEFSFGKYGPPKRMTLIEVIENDAQYVSWCLDNEVISLNPKIEQRVLKRILEN